VNARLHVSGGALGGGRMVEDSSSVAGSGFKILKQLKFYVSSCLIPSEKCPVVPIIHETVIERSMSSKLN
jgi:hypothetical protein